MTLQNEDKRPAAMEGKLQFDPELQEGRASYGRITAATIAAIFIVTLVLYGMTHQDNETAGAAARFSEFANNGPSTEGNNTAANSAQANAQQNQGAQPSPQSDKQSAQQAAQPPQANQGTKPDSKQSSAQQTQSSRPNAPTTTGSGNAAPGNAPQGGPQQ